MKRLIRNLVNNSEFGLVINWKFHCQNKWVSAYGRFLAEAIIHEFNPIIISSQLDYELNKCRLKHIISFEPGWASPKIRYDITINCIKMVMYSDPHMQPIERRCYFDNNAFDYVLSMYDKPFFKHFKNFPKEKFVHFPWAVPDQFVSTHDIVVRTNEVVIFGARASDAYDIRNWCREQEGITNYDFSGVENKKLKDEDYYLWLQQFDAVVAAGSSLPDYDLVTPKYFEIVAAGALLIGQYCKDLGALGFDQTNALIFTKQDFVEKVNDFKKNPDKYLEIRKRGRDLIIERHKLSDRIKLIKGLILKK